jgi:hypothetical protein
MSASVATTGTKKPADLCARDARGTEEGGEGPKGAGVLGAVTPVRNFDGAARTSRCACNGASPLPLKQTHDPVC